MVPGVDAAVGEPTFDNMPNLVAMLPIPEKSKVLVARVWAGPGAFVSVFLLGFFVAFFFGAIAMWGGHDPEKLLAEGRIDDAIVVIDAAARPSADWMRIKGHALHGKGLLSEMLLAYQKAVAGKAVDALALQHTIEALGNEQVASLAVKTLEDWPGDADVDNALLLATTDQVYLRRHRATETLSLRPSATPTIRLQAQVKNAVTDTRSDVCEHKLAGIKALYALADKPEAAAFLKSAGAWNAVYDINAAVILRHRCLSEDIVRKTDTALAKVERE